MICKLSIEDGTSFDPFQTMGLLSHNKHAKDHVFPLPRAFVMPTNAGAGPPPPHGPHGRSAVNLRSDNHYSGTLTSYDRPCFSLSPTFWFVYPPKFAEKGSTFSVLKSFFFTFYAHSFMFWGKHFFTYFEFFLIQYVFWNVFKTFLKRF